MMKTTPYLSTVYMSTGKSYETSGGIDSSTDFLNFYWPGAGFPISIKWTLYVLSAAFFSQKQNILFLYYILSETGISAKQPANPSKSCCYRLSMLNNCI